MAPTKSNSSSDCLSNCPVHLKSKLALNTEDNNFKLSKSRWKILAQAIRNKGNPLKNAFKECDTNNDLNSPHILRYPSYDLIQCKTCTDPHIKNSTEKDNGELDNYNGNRRTWYNILAKGYGEISLKISCIIPNFSIEELNGFNNTGNVCIWPSEECLSIFCLENRDIFKNKSVIEIGAGMTGLAGLIVAQACDSQNVTLTDGNEVSVKNLAAIIKENKLNAKVSSRLFKWNNTDESTKEKVLPQYDVAICADCVFFDEGRPQLMSCLANSLKSGGIAIVVAPMRSGTLDDFVKVINKEKQLFNPAKINNQYSEKIWLRRQHLLTTDGSNFKEDTDYPVMLMCERI